MGTAKASLVVSISQQRAELFVDGRRYKTYAVSTAAKGVGCDQGSNKTPDGVLAVAEKIGDGALSGTVFKSRVPTGERWTPEDSNPLCHSDADLILTRILWLEGREAHNANTKDRYIYIHGTNREDLIGTPVSHGCIRMRNQDVIELFDAVPLGTEVVIRQ